MSDVLGQPLVAVMRLWQGGIDDPFEVAVESEQSRQVRVEVVADSGPLRTRLVDAEEGDFIVFGPHTWDGYVIYDPNGERMFWNRVPGLRPGWKLEFPE